MPVRVPRQIFEETFASLRRCGAGRRECQALWVGPWSDPELVTKVVHPRHSASAIGFDVDEDWFNDFWTRLADHNLGVRLQVHTHPGVAYHSSIDDENPVVATPGFLSLVIPNFALGPVGFDGAFLAQIDEPGKWKQVRIDDHLEVL
jgi:hypothetical protein